MKNKTFVVVGSLILSWCFMCTALKWWSANYILENYNSFQWKLLDRFLSCTNCYTKICNSKAWWSMPIIPARRVKAGRSQVQDLSELFRRYFKRTRWGIAVVTAYLACTQPWIESPERIPPTNYKTVSHYLYTFPYNLSTPTPPPPH